MTVKELITKLLEYPMDSSVVDPQHNEVTFSILLEPNKPRSEHILFFVTLPKYEIK